MLESAPSVSRPLPAFHDGVCHRAGSRAAPQAKTSEANGRNDEQGIRGRVRPVIIEGCRNAQIRNARVAALSRFSIHPSHRQTAPSGGRDRPPCVTDHHCEEGDGRSRARGDRASRKPLRSSRERGEARGRGDRPAKILRRISLCRCAVPQRGRRYTILPVTEAKPDVGGDFFRPEGEGFYPGGCSAGCALR